MADEDAATRPRFEEVIVDELQARSGDGVATQSEQPSQLARERQRCPGRQSTVEHGPHDVQAHPGLEGAAGGWRCSWNSWTH
jgi:hypothetical protein